jgi:hypothetical protein
MVFSSMSLGMGNARIAALPLGFHGLGLGRSKTYILSS